MPKTKLLHKDQLPELLTIAETATRLGKGYSRSSILRRIESGEWVKNRHWIDDSRQGTTRRRVLINVDYVQQQRFSPWL